MSKYDIVREEIIPGSLQDFRALMHELFELQPEFSNDRLFIQGERTPSDYPENRARWEITLGGTLHQRGLILARQLHSGTTRLQFSYHRKFASIGSKFDVEFANHILEQIASGGIETLKGVLQQHFSNLHKLEEQAAIYGMGEHPLRLLNQIENEKQIIAELENRIKDLTDSANRDEIVEM